jgi:hypothetical protein
MVLQQSSLVDPYIEEHKKILCSEFPGKSEAWITRRQLVAEASNAYIGYTRTAGVVG